MRRAFAADGPLKAVAPLTRLRTQFWEASEVRCGPMWRAPLAQVISDQSPSTNHSYSICCLAYFAVWWTIMTHKDLVPNNPVWWSLHISYDWQYFWFLLILTRFAQATMKCNIFSLTSVYVVLYLFVMNHKSLSSNFGLKTALEPLRQCWPLLPASASLTGST